MGKEEKAFGMGMLTMLTARIGSDLFFGSDGLLTYAGLALMIVSGIIVLRYTTGK